MTDKNGLPLFESIEDTFPDQFISDADAARQFSPVVLNASGQPVHPKQLDGYRRESQQPQPQPQLQPQPQPQLQPQPQPIRQQQGTRPEVRYCTQCGHKLGGTA